MTRTDNADFTVSASELGTTDFLVPKDLPDEADQVDLGSGHRAWSVKLVAGANTDADVDLQAAVTTHDDVTFSEWDSEGGTSTALNGVGNSPPDNVAMIFSDEAAIDGINARLTPAADPTAGDYKVVFTSEEV